MNKRCLALVAALMMIAASTSCAADNSSSENASSVVKTAASSAVNDDVPAPAAMDSAYKVLDCLDVPGIPSAIYSCGNLVAVQCRTVDGDGQNSIKYYIVDAEKDELIRTVDGGNSREILLGVDAEGGLTAEIWKDWVDASDEPQQLVSYKPDGTRTAEEYDGDMMFLKYDNSGQLFDLSNGVAKLGSDGSREVIFDSVEANETRSFDASKNRAAVSYLKESFTRATNIYGSDDDPYFARDYGKLTPLEDRATLIEILFTDAYDDPAEYMDFIEDISENCPHMKAKYDYLADWTKQLFGYVYWEEMLGIDK